MNTIDCDSPWLTFKELGQKRKEQFKKSYKQGFDIIIEQKSLDNIKCNTYSQFKDAVDGGHLKRIRSMAIKLDLSFKRGNGNMLDDYINEFIIRFRPYEIVFTRQSNHNDSSMNQIEEQIKILMNQFPVANSIFCDKN